MGGRPADAYEYPSFATTGDAPAGRCGATLIHPDVLVTAAHCGRFQDVSSVFVGSGATPGGVYIGSISIDGSALNVTQVETVSEHIHPRFDPQYFDNDIMLVKLATPQTDIPLQHLNAYSTIPADGQKVTAIGFGKVGTNGPYSDELLEVVIQARNFAACNEDYDGDLIKPLHLCAADPTGRRDSCYGDSGSPLMTQDGAQVGISSFDNGGCGVPEGGVYTRISTYKRWIEQTICEISEVPPGDCESASSGGGGGGGIF